MSKFLRFCLSVVLILTSLNSAFTEKPSLEEISSVMEEILNQHGGRKEIDGETLKHSFSNYLNQFDPYKLYLLEEEASPYLDPEPEKLKEGVVLYSKKNYAPYRELHDLIRQAIKRSQAIFEELKGERDSLFEKGDPPWEHLSFAKDREELKKRMREDIRGFISHAAEKWGSLAVLKKKERVLSLYEREKRELEAPYLFLNSEGEKLSLQEASHQFSLFILKALAKTLDPHTAVFDEEEAQSMKIRLQKGYEGAGITLEEGLDGIFISAIAPKSPAERSEKIAVGDLILAIDGIPLTGKSLRAASKLLSGGEGTAVSLILRKKGREEPISVRLVRELIILEGDRTSSSYEKIQDGIIGTIALNSFYQNKLGVSSEKDVKHAIEKLKQSGPLRGLILDLRGNSGGYLSEAVRVAGLFVSNGVIVISKYHDGSSSYYRDFDGKTFYEGPLVILTSRMTASAAEIVAQALQDWGIGIVVGDERTFGKGSIQNQTVTEDTKNGSFFKVTVGQYYTVSGKSPESRGVEADIVVPGIYGELPFAEKGSKAPQRRIEPAFEDALSDVEPQAKGWFLRYYLPSLQMKKTAWRQMIPALRLESRKRLERTSFLEKASLEEFKDLQLEEAHWIIKDMIRLEQNSREPPSP